MQRMGTRGVGLFLAFLTLAALALNAYRWRAAGTWDPMLALPTLGLAVMLLALPFLAGWRPWQTRSMAACDDCGTLWLPQIEGARDCPACGGKPGIIAA